MKSRNIELLKPPAPDKKGGAHQPKCEVMVEAAIENLKQVVVIQHELLCRLLDEQYPAPMNLAEALEDAANRLLDFSEGIIQHNQRAKSGVWLVD